MLRKIPNNNNKKAWIKLSEVILSILGSRDCWEKFISSSLPARLMEEFPASKVHLQPATQLSVKFLSRRHPRRPRGQIVGASLNRRKNIARRKVKYGKKSPWGQCLTRIVPNGRRLSGFWLVPENVCVFHSAKMNRLWRFGENTQHTSNVIKRM